MLMLDMLKIWYRMEEEHIGRIMVIYRVDYLKMVV
jgi:hypothetical protein